MGILDYVHSHEVNLYNLSWQYNIQTYIRDGFKVFQSGEAAYETKISLGVSLENIYVLFKDRNRAFNPLLKLASKMLAYANFDDVFYSNKNYLMMPINEFY